jgi:hypothetical protein
VRWAVKGLHAQPTSIRDWMCDSLEKLLGKTKCQVGTFAMSLVVCHHHERTGLVCATDNDV